MRYALGLFLPCCLAAQTLVRDGAAKARLLGRHGLTCQWVSWGKDRGWVDVTEVQGRMRMKGEQVAAQTGDRVAIEGEILEVEKASFRFRGRIVLQVSHLNGGKPCVRQGEWSFQIRGGRRFWRMHPMENPCDPPVVDYVDVHF